MMFSTEGPRGVRILAIHRIRVIRSGRQSQSRCLTLNLPYPILGLIPGLAWLTYFYLKGRRARTSFSNALKVFLCGCLATLPTAIIEQLTGAALVQESILSSAWVSFLLIGPLEETAKLTAVWIAIYRSQDFREPIDGIVSAITAALGFACVENIVYIGYLGPEVILSRTVFATPAHALFSSMWGYSMGLARFRRRGELTTILGGLILASELHGAYNFVVAVHPKIAMLSLLPLMMFMAWLLNVRTRELRRSFPFPPIGEGVVVCCPNCGAYTLEERGVCSRCDFDISALETDTPRYCGRCRALLDSCVATCPRCGSEMRIPGLSVSTRSTQG